MNDFPKLHINLEKIKRNTKRIVDIAKQSGIEIVGVTKASCGDPKVGKAMLDGGALGLADSRISNIKRLKEDLPDTSCMLLRSPMISEIPQVIQYADSSINTELTVIKALSKEAEKQGKIHNILLMAELGELREGIVSTEFNDILSYVQSSDSLHLLGIGMNLTCFSGVIPTEEKIDEFLHLIDSIEGILLGRETIHRTAIDQTFQDAFVLEAELIEVKEKPSVPDGELTENAFGEKPVFEDQGEIIRGIAAVGMQDTILDDLIPCDDTISVLGGSSDHLILQLPDKKYSVGDTVTFIPKYGALVHLFTSNYVHKTYDSMGCMN